MYAFEPGGVPHIQDMGSDITRLSWTVDHLPGTKLLLIVLDSQNNTGGIPKKFYDVVADPTSSNDCISKKTNPPSTFRLSANVTDQLITCQPWGLTAIGGTPPYTIYLTALGSDTISVIEMDAADNTLIYPDRIDPNTLVIGSVRDSLGMWGNSTQAVSTTGSKDVICPGQPSISEFQTPPDQPNNSQPNDHKPTNEQGHHHTTTIVIIAVVVGVTVPLLIILGLAYWWRRRQTRKARNNQPRDGIWDNGNAGTHVQHAVAGATGIGELGEMYQQTSPSLSPGFSSYGPLTPTPTYPDHDNSTNPLLRQKYFAANTDPYHSSSVISSSAGYTSHSSVYSNATSSPVPLGGFSLAQRKAIEAAMGERQPRELVLSVSGPSDNPSSVYSQIPSGAAQPTKAGWHDEANPQPSVIVQHLDGGSGAVQEVPPPYIGGSNPAQNHVDETR
ncbi:hypothetical protein QCA50_018005 [Cerrena zonata]|uniref:Uncharacterized protein n=1 Tax=Cerrena zonata TaxID=2478898 RepID=A0AAW0FEB0_9APHY